MGVLRAPRARAVPNLPSCAHHRRHPPAANPTGTHRYYFGRPLQHKHLPKVPDLSWDCMPPSRRMKRRRAKPQDRTPLLGACSTISTSLFEMASAHARASAPASHRARATACSARMSGTGSGFEAAMANRMPAIRSRRGGPAS
jgi:hypothetical protein